MLLLGLDISTSCTGFCVLNKSGDVVLLDYEDFKGCKDFWEKADRVEEKIKNILGKLKSLGRIEKVFVEESLQKFRPGLSSAKTLTTLSKFNGITCYLVRSHTECSPEYLNVNTARKLVGLKVIRGKDTKEQTITLGPGEVKILDDLKIFQGQNKNYVNEFIKIEKILED